jgi:hypothetical protein
MFVLVMLPVFVMPLKAWGAEKVFDVEVETPPPAQPPTMFAHGTCRVFGFGVIVFDESFGTHWLGVLIPPPLMPEGPFEAVARREAEKRPRAAEAATAMINPLEVLDMC